MSKIYTYLAFDGSKYKIGQSKNPDQRIQSMKTASPNIELICFGVGISEKDLHNLYHKYRIKGEWFRLHHNQVVKIKGLIEDGIEGIKKQTSLKVKSMLIESYKKYVISFGKYKGRRLVTMKNDDEYNYVTWYVENVYNEKSAKQRTFGDKAFAWWYMNS